MRGAGLLATKLFWVLAYDTEFAMVDRNDDRHLGIQTLALALGRFDATVVTGFYAIHLASWAWQGLQVSTGVALDLALRRWRSGTAP